MKISLVLLVGVIAAARAATGRYDVGSEGPGDFSVTHPSTLESSSVPGIRDNKQGQRQRPQDHLATGSSASLDFPRDQNLFLSHNLGTPEITTSPSKSSVKGQFNEVSSQHPQAFFNDKQDSYKQPQFMDERRQNPAHTQIPLSYNDNQQSLNEQRFLHADQQFPSEEQFLNNGEHQQQFYDDQQQQHQIYNDQQQQQFYNDQQQQFFDDRQQKSAQQQFFNRQPSPIQQRFFNDKQQPLKQQSNNDQHQALIQQQPRDQREIYNVQSVGISGKQLNNKRFIQDVGSHKVQVKSNEPSIQIHSVSKGAVQLSAFDNRAQPLVLPQSTAMHSSSVVVSGLKNMPLLPAMVYNGGALPITHAAVLSRDPLYKGGAAIRQHLQTPFVRYVYSHVL